MAAPLEKHYLRLHRGRPGTAVYKVLEIQADEPLVVCVHREAKGVPGYRGEPLVVLHTKRMSGSPTIGDSRVPYELPLYNPEDFVPTSGEGDAADEAMCKLGEEMRAAGIWPVTKPPRESC